MCLSHEYIRLKSLNMQKFHYFFSAGPKRSNGCCHWVARPVFVKYEACSAIWQWVDESKAFWTINFPPLPPAFTHTRYVSTALFVPMATIELLTNSPNTSMRSNSFMSFKRLISQVSFLGATKHLYNWLCPLVCRSVCLSGNAFVRRSTRRTTLAYLALFPR